MREVSIEFKWEWQKDFESYLLILYFNCEGKDPHIRTEKCHGEKQKYHTFSWSPRHPELGLIAHLLFYANILNGFKKNKKQSLRNKLKERFPLNQENVHSVVKIIKQAASR